MLAVFAAALALYAYTTPSAVTLEDDGIFIGSLHYFGVSHPPGYPLHTFLGGIFYHLLPFGTPAFKAHLFSGVAAAAACALIYAATAMLTPGRIAPLLAAASCAVSKVFWSQAIITEVYTLNAFLFFLLLVLALQYVAYPRRKTLFYMGLVCGMGLANHYLLFMMAGSGVALYVFLQVRRKWHVLLTGALIALGTAVIFYGWMIWRSHANIPANFYSTPIDNAEIFFYYLLRLGYAGADDNPAATLYDKLIFGQFLLRETLIQYTPAGLVLAAVGIGVMCREPRQRLLGCSLLLSMLCVSVLIILVRNTEASYIGLAVFRVYHVTSYGLLAIPLALGAAALARRLARLTGQAANWYLAAAALLVPIIVSVHWQDNNRRDYRWAEELAQAKLDSVEANALVFTSGDLDFPTGYLHYVKGVRPDLTILNKNGFLYGSPLFSPFLAAHPEEAEDDSANQQHLTIQFISQSHRPVYFPVGLESFFTGNSLRSDLLGFYRRISHRRNNIIQLSPSLLRWLQRNVDRRFNATDRWTRISYHITIKQLMSAVLAAQWSGATMSAEWQAVIDHAQRVHSSVRTMVNGWHLQQNTLSPQQIDAALAECEQTNRLPLSIDDVSNSQFYLLCAKLLWHSSGDPARAEEYLQTALLYLRTPDNPALTVAINYYQTQSQPCSVKAIIKRFYPQADDLPTDLAAVAQNAAGACPSHES